MLKKKEGIPEDCILPSQKENNKGHETNSHEWVRFWADFVGLILSFYLSQENKNLTFLGNFGFVAKKTLISKVKRKELYFKCLHRWEKECAVLRYFVR